MHSVGNTPSVVGLFEGVNRSGIRLFEKADMQVNAYANAASDEQLAWVQNEAQLLGIRSRTKLNAAFFDGCRKLEAVGCFCIGTNQVDLAAARARGIAVFNAPHSNTRSVAELVLGHIIMLMRRIPVNNRLMHCGKWNKSADLRYEIRGKTLGIVGYGNIGSQLSVLAESLGMRVIYHDLANKLALGNAQPVNSLHTLLQRSDVISLHVPETSSTHMMINAERLAQCKKGAVLINIARGTVVDIEALSHALKSDHIGGAALDVFPNEPEGKESTFTSPLVGCENVILTSHIGGSTVEAQAAIGEEVAQKMIEFHRYGSSDSAVNFPRISLQPPKKVRLLHLHHNVPGVMSAINQVIADLGVNISGSHLNTFDNLGYVSVDIEDTGVAAKLCAQLKQLPETIWVRALDGHAAP